MNKFVFLISVFTLLFAHSYAQVSPDIIVKNRISKAFYYETDVDSTGKFKSKDELKYEVFYDTLGNTVLTKGWVNSKKSDLAIRWYHNQFDDDHNKIEDFIIDQKSDSTYSDTLFHHVYDYEKDKLIRQTNIPHFHGTSYPKSIISYHYVREGFYFTYQKGKSKSTNPGNSYRLTRTEYRSENNVDSTITFKWRISTKYGSGFNNPSKAKRDTINITNPDTSISVVESTLPNALWNQIVNNASGVNLKYKRVEVIYSISNGKKLVREVNLFNDFDEMYVKLRIRNEEIRMLIEIYYTDNGLYIGAQKKYLPENRIWNRKVEYKTY